MKPLVIGYSVSKEQTSGLIARGIHRSLIYQLGYLAETLEAAVIKSRGRNTALCIMDADIARPVPKNCRWLDISWLAPVICETCGNNLF